MDDQQPSTSRAPKQMKRRAEAERNRREHMTVEQKAEEAARAKRRRQLMTDEQKQQDRNKRLLRQQNFTTCQARNPEAKPSEYKLGDMNHVCDNCGARHFNEERNYRKKFSTCCSGGTFQLPPLRDYPELLISFLTNPEEGKHFRINIRKYNSAMAFASFGHKSPTFRRGPQVFVIQGQVYHRIATETSAGENQPSYSQLYFIDPEVATGTRMNHPHNNDCKREIFEALDRLIREINPYAKAYQLMKDVVNTAGKPETVQLWIVKDRLQDIGRYNLPVSNDIAAVFTSEDGEPPFERDICVYPHGNNQLKTLSITSPNCDPMVYPLLFPYGEFGWQPGIKKNSDGKRNNVTQQEFYGYRLQERTGFNQLMHAGKLTQQYIVDAFLKVEACRLRWCRENQKNLRVELYMGLMDYVNSQADQQNLKAGRICILPSSFTGGKRALAQNYQDAMTMVAKFGKPDLFITFTCNPKWQEISTQLSQQETTVDRPDLTSTVFHLKLKEFMVDMLTKKIFGTVTAFMSVIEFQKRGLPHCHMLFILDNDNKFKDSQDVDNVVSAEIPNEETDRELFAIVTSCMIHGPCGEVSPNAPCMAEKSGSLECSKGFPKPFTESTNMNVDGYPEYKRRNNGDIIVKGRAVNNAWVVPYNPYLTRKYNAHINVEICSSVKSVKYIFKYVYKGYDAATIKLNENGQPGSLEWDEIQTYIDTRYVAAPEAMWRLREYKMHDRSHAIQRLAVHLPSQQAVIFQEGEEQKALERSEKSGTTLTAWFKLNDTDADARKYLYTEIPYHYVFQKQNGTWQRRKLGHEKILPRMYSVSPKDPERFSLRLLLLHVKGARSFNDLKTINGQLYPSFLEAAKALNLLEDDTCWTNAMKEAASFEMPWQLRILFTTILTFGNPSEPKLLYAQFKQQLMEDYLREQTIEVSENLMLTHIKELLHSFGKTCSDFGLLEPEPNYYPNLINTMVNLAVEKEEAARLKSMLNAEQQLAFTTIVNAVENKLRRKCFFLSGAGGCGKTFLYQTLISEICSRGQKVKVVAPTGLAATLLKNGQTVHSGFKMPLDLSKSKISFIKQGSKEHEELKTTTLIIWDEISMCHKDLLEGVDESLRDIMGCNEPFGGICIVVGGDFRQQAPVVKHGNRVKIVEACVKSSRLWKNFEKLELKTNMRVSENEQEFIAWLLKIGGGETDSRGSDDFAKIDQDVLSDNIISDTFGTNISVLSAEQLAAMAVLCPTNEATLLINEDVLKCVAGETYTFYSMDSISDCQNEEEQNMYPVEFLHSLTPMGMPPHALNLKKGCCVMLMRNLNMKLGLCNGTRLIVHNLGNHIVDCRIFSGDRKGQRVFIPRICLNSSDGDIPFGLKRKQFPIRLAYSMTITKSQGQTFDKIGVYLPQPVFTHGQLYTAFSRVRSRTGLRIQIFPGSKQGHVYNDNETYTYNCVYREIL